MGWRDRVHALQRASIGSKGIRRVQLIYDCCCDKGSDMIVMARGRVKGERGLGERDGKDKVGIPVGGGARRRNMFITLSLRILSKSIHSVSTVLQ